MDPELFLAGTEVQLLSQHPFLYILRDQSRREDLQNNDSKNLKYILTGGINKDLPGSGLRPEKIPRRVRDEMCTFWMFRKIS